MPYTIHEELTDATLMPASATLATKRLALEVARKHAASKPWAVARVVVCKGEQTVAEVEVPRQ
jgi:hypothetical protein